MNNKFSSPKNPITNIQYKINNSFLRRKIDDNNKEIINTILLILYYYINENQPPPQLPPPPPPPRPLPQRQQRPLPQQLRRQLPSPPQRPPRQQQQPLQSEIKNILKEFNENLFNTIQKYSYIYEIIKYYSNDDETLYKVYEFFINFQKSVLSYVHSFEKKKDIDKEYAFLLSSNTVFNDKIKKIAPDLFKIIS